MVVDGLIHICVSDLLVTRERSSAVDFPGGGIVTNTNRLFMRLSTKEDASWTTFVSSFETDFWLGIVGTSAVSMAALYLMFNAVPRETKIGVNASVTTVVLPLIGLDIPERPKKAPGRMLVAFILFCGSVIFWSYTAGLVSHLSVSSSKLPISSMEDLTKDRSLRIVMEINTPSLDYFRDADPGILKVFDSKTCPRMRFPQRSNLPYTVSGRRGSKPTRPITWRDKRTSFPC